MTKRILFLFLTISIPILMIGRHALADSAKTRAFIKVLQSDVSVFEKVRVCQQLGEMGTEEAVPVLASFLSDKVLAASARNALERIAGEASAAALREALEQTDGTFLVGVIHSLAALQDKKSVPGLVARTKSSDIQVSRASLLALGRISDEASVAHILKTLDSGNEVLRAEAAAACLLAAEHKSETGQPKQAQALYSAVRKAQVPTQYQVAATRGAILTRSSDGVPFLVEQLRSQDRAVRNVALLTVRDMPGDELADALTAELQKALPDLQVQLIYAMRDCHNDRSSAAIQSFTDNSDPGVRLAALTVLADIGGPETAEIFLETVIRQRSSEEIALAMHRLDFMEGEAVDGLILKTLSAPTDEKAQISLIRLIRNRRIAHAKDQLFRLAEDPNPRVRIAAFQAINPLVTSVDLTPLLALTKASEDKSVRDAAELAVYHACRNTEDITESSELISSELQKADRFEDQKSWITVLSMLGYDQALPGIFTMIRESDQALAEFAVYQLRRWPNPAPIEELFKIIEEKPDLHQRALAAIIQLATAAADQQQMTELPLVACFQRAGQLAGTVQAKRGILSGLGRVQHMESIRVSAPYLDDPEVEMEAAFAIVNACQWLSDANEYTTIESILDRIAQMDDANLRRLIRNLKARRETWWTPLFNGKDLSGWAATGQAQWSVQDGLLLGTQTTGTGGDLVTANLYEDFELRFTYRVTWPANSGIWFRYNRDTQKGYQFDILKNTKPEAYSGTLYSPGKMFLTENLNASLENRDSWNEGSILAKGADLTLTLNGHQVGQCADAAQHTGSIGIEVHSGQQFKGMQIVFKRIEIRRPSVR